MTVAGDLRERIYLQQRDPALGALREQSKAWIMYTPDGIWAKPFTPKSRQFFAAGQEQAQGSLVFRVRFRTDVTPQMRLLWNGTPYDIVGTNIVTEGGGREWTDIVADTGVRDGRVN